MYAAPDLQSGMLQLRCRQLCLLLPGALLQLGYLALQRGRPTAARSEERHHICWLRVANGLLESWALWHRSQDLCFGRPRTL